MRKGTRGADLPKDGSVIIPIDQIESMSMTLGERCRVVEHSEANSHTRTLTITTETGWVCTFKGEMEFTFEKEQT